MSMDRSTSTAILKRLVDLYMSTLKEDIDIPNTPSGLFDDFGNFIDQYRDDITNMGDKKKDESIH